MADHEPDADAPTPGAAPLQVLQRRWPLLLAGLAIGAVAGALIQLTGTPVYQSNAEILVFRKRAEIATGNANANSASVVDDYVGAQLRILRGVSVRRAAARELRLLVPSAPIDDDNLDAVANSFLVGFTATRDKDSVGANGSGIVLLGFRRGDPADAKNYLQAVITAYQKELTGIYDASTTDKINVLERTIETYQKDIGTAKSSLYEKEDALRKLTSEDLAGGVRPRVTSQREKLSALESDLIKLTSQIGQIAAAGPNRGERLAVLAQLTGLSKQVPIGTEQAGPEQILRQAQSRKRSLSARLGPDHADMIELDAQIAFYTAEIARQNPTNPTGSYDELGVMDKGLRHLKAMAELQETQLRGKLETDEKLLISAGKVKSEVDALAAQIAERAAEVGRLQQDLRSTRVSLESGGYRAAVITPPGEGGKVGPILMQSLMLGLALGGALGVGAMALSEFADKSFKSPAEIRRRLGVAVIGHVPTIRTDSTPDGSAPAGLAASLVAALRPKGSEAEAYRGVRTQLYFNTQGKVHQVIQVTSPNPGDGKSTLAANLAISIAQSGKRVVLIDCDFRKPQVQKLFGLGTVEVGLSGVVAGTAPLARALRRSAVENLDLMPCGKRPDNPAELLTSPQFEALIADLKAAYDYVIVDTPPVLAVSDPCVVAPRVNGVIMVFRMTKAARPAAERTRDQLVAVGANILGVVVNAGEARGEGYYNGYNYGSNAGYRYIDYEHADHYAEGADAAPAAR